MLTEKAKRGSTTILVEYTHMLRTEGKKEEGGREGNEFW